VKSLKTENDEKAEDRERKPESGRKQTTNEGKETFTSTRGRRWVRGLRGARLKARTQTEVSRTQPVGPRKNSTFLCPEAEKKGELTTRNINYF